MFKLKEWQVSGRPGNPDDLIHLYAANRPL